MKQHFENSLKPLLDIFVGHPYIQAAIVAFMTLFLAYMITWGVIRLLKKMAAQTQTNLDDIIIKALRPPMFYTMVSIGLTIAIKTTPFADDIKKPLIAILQTVMIILWARFIIRISKIVLRKLASEHSKFKIIQLQTLPLFENLVLIFSFAFSTYIVFTVWGVDMTAWMTSAGILGIAVGFAAKDTLANLFSGVFILADAPYKIGDYIVIDSKDRGAVTHIGIRSTRILTRDDVELTIPNSIMGNSKVINESGGPNERYRIRIKVGVAYGSDVDQVKRVLLNIAINNELVCKQPKPRIRFRQLGDSSLDFELLGWIEKPELRGKAVDVLLTDIYKTFIKEQIEIPFPQRDVHIRQIPKND